MKTINLRWMYPHYRHDEFVDVTDEVWAAMYIQSTAKGEYLNKILVELQGTVCPAPG